MVEVKPHVIPAAVAGVIINHAVRRRKFIRRMREPGNHHHRHLAPPRQPAQSRTQPDEEVRVLDEVDPLLQRFVPRLVLHSPRHVIPDQTRAVHTLLVDADYTVSIFLQELDHLVPAVGIVPVLRLTRTLAGDADIFLFDFSRRGKIEPRRFVRWIHPENIARRPVQTNIAEVDRLMIHVPPEEQSHVIAGIRLVILRLLRRDEGDLRVLIAHHVGDPRRHHADDFTVVLLLKPFHIAEPADRIADRPHRQLNHHLFSGRVVVMRENRLPAALLVDDQPEPDEEFLDARHICPGNRIVAVQDDPRVDVRERDVILFAVVREQDPDPVVEVELYPLNSIQNRNLRNLTINARLFRRLCLRQGRRWKLGNGNAGTYGDVIDIQSRTDTEVIHDIFFASCQQKIFARKFIIYSTQKNYAIHVMLSLRIQ